jgi:hypothetical protein
MIANTRWWFDRRRDEWVCRLKDGTKIYHQDRAVLLELLRMISPPPRTRRVTRRRGRVRWRSM